MNRFYISPEEFNKEIISISGEDFHHLSKVLRLKENDQIEVFNSDNMKALGTITKVNKNDALVELKDKEPVDTENQKISISLFQGVPKKGKLETICQKATELGVTNIVPFYSKRSVVRPSKSDTKKTQRYQRVAYEASKQSGRGIIPKVMEPVNFNDLERILENFDIVLLAYEDEKNLTLKEALKTINKSKDKLKIALIIGPEGGFDSKEVMNLKFNPKTQVVSLGNRILRTETAGIATISQLNFYFEDE